MSPLDPNGLPVEPSDSSELAEFSEFFFRVQDNLYGGDIFGNLADWICNNTFLNNRKFSFHEHEFQRVVAGDPAPEGFIIKCSQVGLTELAIRMALAYLAIAQGKSLIYVLPTSRFASKFAKSRIDPVIEDSPKLSDLLVTAADSAEMKRLGQSFLYINGAANQDQAISVPAQALFIDEYDFCNPTVLSTYNSRLRHAKGDFYKRNWSTPTIEGYGVEEGYQTSKKNRYMVRCEHCEKISVPEFTTDVVIPGFDKPFAEFDKDALADPAVSVSKAYVACGFCKRSLDNSLLDPARREWVAEHPSRDITGYAIRPVDLPVYNSTQSILRQARDYVRTQDYYNFVLGETFTPKNSQFDMSVVKSMATHSQEVSSESVCLGIDVGKTCNLILGHKERSQYVVTDMLRVKMEVGDSLFKQIEQICVKQRVAKIVIDAGPDFSLVSALQERFGDMVHPCVYVADNLKMPDYYDVSESKKTINVVSAQRTKGLDALVETANKGSIRFIKNAEYPEFVTQLRGMKRIEHRQENGELVARWVKTGPDHYFHTLFYFKLACDILNHTGGSAIIPAPYKVSGVEMGSSVQKQRTQEHPSNLRQMMNRFGVR